MQRDPAALFPGQEISSDRVDRSAFLGFDAVADPKGLTGNILMTKESFTKGATRGKHCNRWNPVGG